MTYSLQLKTNNYNGSITNILVVRHLPACGAVGVPAVRARRPNHDMVDTRCRQEVAYGQCAWPQMGTYVHHLGGVRRCVFRIIPALLFHQFRWGLLAVDADSVELHPAGGEL